MLDSTVVCRRALGCEWGGEDTHGTFGVLKLHRHRPSILFSVEVHGRQAALAPASYSFLSKPRQDCRSINAGRAALAAHAARWQDVAWTDSVSACRPNAPVALQAIGEAFFHKAWSTPCAHCRRVHHLEGCALERKGAACIQCNIQSAVRQARALARCGRSLSPGAADSHAHAKLERNGVHPSVSFGRPFGSACALRSRLQVVCLPQRHAVVVAASFAVCRGPARVGQLPRWRLRGASALPISAGFVEMVL